MTQSVRVLPALLLLAVFTSPAHPQEPRAKDLAGLEKLDARLHAAGSDEARELADSLRKGLVTLRDPINERDVQAWRRIKSRKDWETFRDARLTKLNASLYDQPPKFIAPPEPTPVHVTRTIAGEGFVVENLL